MKYQIGDVVILTNPMEFYKHHSICENKPLTITYLVGEHYKHGMLYEMHNGYSFFESEISLVKDSNKEPEEWL